jgi:hypothetical protein
MCNLLPFGDCLSVTGGELLFNVEGVRVPIKSA